MNHPSLSRKLASSVMLSIVSVGLSGSIFSAAAATTELPKADRLTVKPIQRAYTHETVHAGGTWSSYVTMVGSDNDTHPVIDTGADHLVYAYSVNKIAVALTVMDKVDRGQLKLDQKLELTPDIIASGSGLYWLQGAYGDQLTIANLLTTMRSTRP